MLRKYETRSLTIETVLSWVKSKEIAIPEIQRPFVWNTTQVRNLMDSLLQDYPIGYLITWKNPDVNLKDGSKSEGKRILIDGQQRITALMAALLGAEIVTKDYQRTRIRIAFNPKTSTFEVFNSAIAKDPAWIPDISDLFGPDFEARTFVDEYCARNEGSNPPAIDKAVSALLKIVNNPIGTIELDSSLSIDTVTEIFIRVNSAGVPLNQADFAMSKIAVNEDQGGPDLRKAIDYFCHLAVAPDFYSTLANNDKDFAHTDYFQKMAWLKHENDDLYDPSYSDMLRVVFGSQFRRGRMQELVALLSGRNFETKQHEQKIIDETFALLREGALNFSNETHFKRFIMIIRSAGFVDSSLVGSQMPLNFAYILYLTLRDKGLPDNLIERSVRRWFVMSVLTGRYTGSFESAIDQDIRQIDEHGIEAYAEVTMPAILSEAFWNATLPQAMETSSANSPYFNVYRAAQVRLNDRGFLSRDITVRELVEYKSDVHHVFPKDLLKKANRTRSQYNQIANFVVAQSEINIQIGNKEPAVYFGQLAEQTSGGPLRYGNIADPEELRANLAVNCIPEGVERMTVNEYPAFLVARRKLMAQKIKGYFEGL